MHLSSRIFRTIIACLGTSLLFACNAVANESESRTEPPVTLSAESGLQQVPLTIISKGKKSHLTVEMAQSVEEQARGLMFRKQLSPNGGMIFPFKNDRIASFWMKNTVIPLDIIFIRRNGSIESIAANTVPYSLDPVQSGEPVAAVLEIAGGRAAELGISPGDKVSW